LEEFHCGGFAQREQADLLLSWQTVYKGVVVEVEWCWVAVVEVKFVLCGVRSEGQMSTYTASQIQGLLGRNLNFRLFFRWLSRGHNQRLIVVGTSPKTHPPSTARERKYRELDGSNF